MTVRSVRHSSNSSHWNPAADALWRNRVESIDDTHPTSIVLRHPGTPYAEVIPDTTEAILFEVGRRYVERANQRAKLGIPPAWIAALRDPENPGSTFGWSRVWARDDTGEAGRGASFWMERRVRRARIDRTLVLIASVRSGDTFVNSGFGIRIVAHVQNSARKNTFSIRITGLLASLPFGPYVLRPRESLRFARAANAIYSQVDEARARLAGSLRMAPDSLVFIGSPVFPIDPASQGPQHSGRQRRTTRDDKVLNKRRKSIDKPPEPKDRPGKSDFQLQVPGELTVYPSLFVRSEKAEAVAGKIRKVSLGAAPSARSNDFSAISAYWHFHQMLARMKQYGFSLPSYFRMARLPLKIFYRSGIRPGPGKDGQSVNARVLPEGWPPDFYRQPDPGSAPLLQVHLALANRSTRVRRKRNGAHPTQAEPLGIASDARWMWHEFGHVLLMASVGELEFRFAHSAGDALAAIASDPFSQLAGEPRARGATFPWVFVPRRHDRCVLHGWSWCGSMHRPLTVLTNADRVRRKGYRSEQILSSSLFRLYLCLGGDTKNANGQPDKETRESASQYSLYLIIKAIGLLGDAGKVPTALVDGFVSALIDADVGTDTFDIKISIGSAPTRVGGCAFKPTRWAFEAQGLYAHDLASISNRPGLPEPVDIFIEDRRPLKEENPGGTIEHRAGGYVPVSLDTQSDVAAWHAQVGAIDVRANGVHVVVKNRGQKLAANVTVDVWWVEWPKGNQMPRWNDNNWTKSSSKVAAKPVPTLENQPAGTTFGPFTGFPNTPGVRYMLLAEASCPDDRAISDPTTRLPCSLRPTPLADLVVGDNNIGLLVQKAK